MWTLHRPIDASTYFLRLANHIAGFGVSAYPVTDYHCQRRESEARVLVSGPPQNLWSLRIGEFDLARRSVSHGHYASSS